MIVALYDTNIWISGTFWRGIPRHLIQIARQGQVQAITCQTLLSELESVLVRPSKPFRLSEREVATVIDDILTFTSLIEPTCNVAVCRDSSDNHVLACALSGRADYVVTGDPDLLTLEKLEQTQIVTARDFLAALADS